MAKQNGNNAPAWLHAGEKFARDSWSMGTGKAGDAGTASEFFDALFAAGVRSTWIGLPDRKQPKRELEGPEDFRRTLLSVALGAMPETVAALYRRQAADSTAKKYMTDVQRANLDRAKKHVASFMNGTTQALRTRENAAESAAHEDRKSELRETLNDEGASEEERDAAREALDAILAEESAERYGRVRKSVEEAWKSFANADGSADDDALLVANSAEVQPAFVALFKAAGWDLPEDMKA